MGIYDRPYYRESNHLDLSPNWEKKTAVATLIIINAAIFVANILFSQQTFSPSYLGFVNQALSLSGADQSNPIMWWRTLSYGFVHDAVSPFHLLFNMMGLYFLGRQVEQRYGRNEFYRIYLVSIIICGAAWLLKKAAMNEVEGYLLGASGAVLCIEMLFVLNFPRAIITLFVFPIPAWAFGIFLVLINFVSSPSTGIAYDVHLVGILCAVGYFFLKMDFRFMDDLFGSWRRLVRRWTGPTLRVHNGVTQEALSPADEADRLLEKIHASGQSSLTPKEKKFLERYSRDVRARQNNDPT
jgi:membrane associated rhomboid family serine protease